MVTGVQDGLFNEMFPLALASGRMPFPVIRRIPEAKGTQDYLGVNYYTTEKVAFNLFRPQDFFSKRSFPSGAEVSRTGFIANVPEGLFQRLKRLLKYKLPILITENGIEDADDRIRPRYLLQHLHQVWQGVNFNWPIKGYFHWTLVDNFEWERGWTQRFGLWELDVETQARRKRPSADLYAEICRENGISSEMVAKYAPEIMEKLFPDG
jgi:beta-glucosidase